MSNIAKIVLTEDAHAPRAQLHIYKVYKDSSYWIVGEVDADFPEEAKTLAMQMAKRHGCPYFWDKDFERNLEREYEEEHERQVRSLNDYR